MQVSKGEEQDGLQELLLFHRLGEMQEEKLRMADLQWDVVEEVGVVVSYVPARFTGKNDGSLEERKGRQSALSPSHPHSEVFVDVFGVFLLDPLVQFWEEVRHQIHILKSYINQCDDMRGTPGKSAIGLG